MRTVTIEISYRKVWFNFYLFDKELIKSTTENFFSSQMKSQEKTLKLLFTLHSTEIESNWFYGNVIKQWTEID